VLTSTSLLGGQLDRLTVGDAVLILGLLAGAVGAIRKGWPWLRRTVAFVNAVVGEDARDMAPGQTPRQGVLARLSAVEVTASSAAQHAERAADAAERAAAAAEEATRQLHPNGGSSARDQLDRIATAVGAPPPDQHVDDEKTD
jgi:hypothetical protein